MISLLFACQNAPESFDVEYGRTSQPEPCSPVEEGDYTFNGTEYYFGPLVFQMIPQSQTFQTPEDISELGMNTASLRFNIPFDQHGHIRFPYQRQGLRYESLEDAICQMGNLIHEFKSKGFTVLLSGEPHYHDKIEWMELHPDWDGDFTSVTGFDTEEQIETFISEQGPIMEAMAEMAEKYSVDMVSPISEADRYFEPEPSERFMDLALPYFQDYEGELLWQVFGHELREPDLMDSAFRFDFTQFDKVGLALIGCDNPRYEWDFYIEILETWANEDNVPLMISELGCVRIPDSIDDALDNFNYWHEKTKPYSNGLIVLDTPQSSSESQGVRDTWLEDWVVEIAKELDFLPE
ncbi:MAG: hypothetical protein CMK59_00220 [Proteobacteria bacterium]|nr:hypothetical protein [Pseudomonadota bacterium]